MLVSSYISISAFYFMSGFFVTNSINKIARDYNGLGFLTIFQIYLNRFIRFIPLYYFVLISCWIMLFAKDLGPLWVSMD
jgi:peptidoglycan/LPS O-acetylase OafA/YrhL